MARDELTPVEKNALKWTILQSWIMRNRNRTQGSAQDLWFDMLRFYDGLNDE